MRGRSFSSLDEVTATWAPSAFAIERAAVATPPPMPQIRTHSPSCSRARVESIRYAVRKTSGNAAASSNESASGMGWTESRGSAISSAWVPSIVSPTMCTLPSRMIPGLITTRSSVPAMTPAPSAPRMRGLGTDGKPFRIHTSRWLSDAARSSTSTSPSRGHGIRHVLVAQNLRAAVVVDANRLHAGTILA